MAKASSSGIVITSPLKGVNKNMAWGDHTPDFALDASNVLPFDLDGRQRVIQRPGTLRQFFAPLSDGSSVLFLGQATVPVSPSSPPPRTVVNELFSQYADGSLPSVSSGRWVAVDASTLADDAVSSIVTQGGGASAPTGDNHFAAEYRGPLHLSDAAGYSVKATFQNIGSGSQGFGLFVRRNPTAAAPGDRGIKFFTNPSSVSTHEVLLAKTPIQSEDDVLYENDTVTGLLSGTVTMELKVAGDTFKGYINDVLQFTLTVTDGSTGGVGVVVPRHSTEALTGFTVSYTGTQATYRQTRLIAACNGNIYVGDTASLPLATSGSSKLATNIRPQFAYNATYGYFVDGTSIVKLDIANKSVVTYTASAGTAPTGCTLAAMYRDRLVLAAPFDTPQNFFLSRVGSPLDWDYSQLDPAGAFAGNASTAGHIGDPIIALMPASDDIMYIGGDHTLWAMRGDPKDGGSIDMVSDAIGVLGPNAWTKSPDGTIYFLGTGGLFRLSGTAPPELLTDKLWSDYFRSIDRTANHLTLVWDRDHHGLSIYVTPANLDAATHLWWDARGMGLWPVKFPDLFGPTSALVFDGDGAEDRVTFLGTRSGYVMAVGDAYLTDDGQTIDSYVEVGPFTPSGPLSEATAEFFDVVLGEPSSFHAVTDFNVDVTVKAGPTPERAFATPERTVTRTYAGTSSRQSRWRQRIRGSSFVVRLSNAVSGRTWAFEKIIGMFLPSGTVRRYR